MDANHSAYPTHPARFQKPKTEDQTKIFEVLNGDPEFKHVLDDIKANGPEAMNKYLDDTELMIKVSEKLKAAGLSAGPRQMPPPLAAVAPAESAVAQVSWGAAC